MLALGLRYGLHRDIREGGFRGDSPQGPTCSHHGQVTATRPSSPAPTWGRSNQHMVPGVPLGIAATPAGSSLAVRCI